MNRKLRAIEAFKKLKSKFEPKKVVYRAYAGDGAGNVAVSDRPGYIWVRVVGKTDMLAQAYCRSIEASTGMNIFVEETIAEGKPSYRVIEARPDALGWFDEGDRWENVGSPVTAHSVAHQENGPDMIGVAKAMIEPLRALPTDPASMKVTVTQDQSVMIGENTIMVYPDRDTASVESVAFVAPAWGVRNDLLSIDSAGTQTITAGTVGWVADFPTCPVGEIPIAYIMLVSSTTEILAENILDARPFISVPPDYGIFVHVAGDTMTGPLIIDCNSTAALLVEQDGVKDNVLVVDTTNGRVGVGIAAPLEPLDVVGNIKGSIRLKLPTTTAAIGEGLWFVSSNGNMAALQTLDAGGSTYTFFASNKYYSGSGWVDMGNGRLGSSFQIQNDTFTFYSFNAGTTFLPRFTVASGGNVGVGELSPVSFMEWSSTVPYLTIHNTTEEDTDYGREGKIIFRGEQSGSEESVLGELEFAHDGTGDDQKGIFTVRTNDGSDGATPTDRLTIDSAGLVGINETTPVAQLHVQTSGAAVVGQIIKGTAAQSANYLQVQTSADALEVVIDSAGNLHLKTNNELRFYDNGNYVGFEAPALAADQIWVLPDEDGSADQVLKTDGGGNLGWVLPGGIERTIRITDGDSPYAILATVVVIFCDTDGGAITANLPAGIEGTHYKLINCGSSGNDLTVDPNGGEELYGAGAGVASTLADGEVISIHFNGTEGWY